MLDHFIDFLVIIVFSLLSIFLWTISNTRKVRQKKLLFRALSLFVIFHLIVFPIIYSIMVNSDSESIIIDENILIYEKEKKLEEAKKIEREISSNYNINQKKSVINEILVSDKEILDSISWQDIDRQQLLYLKNRILIGETNYICIPGEKISKVIDIYNLSGQKSVTINAYSNKELLSNILTDHLLELDSDKIEITQEIEKIESNSFWTYRQILPYTINILFTGNFNPKSKSANLVYFFHNVLVVGFLLTFIVSFFQHYLENKKS